MLNACERAAMLYEVSARFQAPDHYRGFHESLGIIYDGDNEDSDRYQRVREYWADLAREYVRSPAALRATYREDYVLAQKWMTRLGLPPVLYTGLR